MLGKQHKFSTVLFSYPVHKSQIRWAESQHLVLKFSVGSDHLKEWKKKEGNIIHTGIPPAGLTKTKQSTFY